MQSSELGYFSDAHPQLFFRDQHLMCLLATIEPWACRTRNEAEPYLILLIWNEVGVFTECGLLQYLAYGRKVNTEVGIFVLYKE